LVVNKLAIRLPVPWSMTEAMRLSGHFVTLMTCVILLAFYQNRS